MSRFLFRTISKSELRVMLLFALIIVVGAGLGYWHLHRAQGEVAEGMTRADSALFESLGREIEPDTLRKYRNRYETQLAKELFPFDPNHDDSVTLRQLGLSEYTVGSMMRYRRKHGVWRTVDAFFERRGLTPEQCARLRPYVRISEEDQPRDYAAERAQRDANHWTNEPQYARQEKYPEGTIIDLNTADTTELKKIPGIGSYFAKKIVQRREALGAYVSVNQVMDIPNVPADLARWFRVEQGVEVRKLCINKGNFQEIVRHPYISYEQTKAIVNYIRAYGPIHSWRDLAFCKEFTDEDIRRLTPYVSFE